MTNSLLSRLKISKEKSTHTQHKHSAVVMLRGRPISFGYNKAEGHPKVLAYSKVKGLHAEISACLRVKDKEILKQCEIIVYRETRDGNPGLSRPCSMCQQFLKDVGIKKVTYSTAEGWKEEII